MIMATRKFPVQFPAVVMETAAPRTLRGNISLVTTQAIGLYASQCVCVWVCVVGCTSIRVHILKGRGQGGCLLTPSRRQS